MIPHDYVKPLIDKTRSHSWREGHTFYLSREEIEDLEQDSLLVLSRLTYDPARARGRAWGDCLLDMVPTVVHRTAVGMYRRKKRTPRTQSPEEVAKGMFDNISASYPIEIMDRLAESVEDWINRKKSDWLDDLHQNRIDGKTAWNHGSETEAKGYADQAGMNFTLWSWAPRQSAVPVLQRYFDYSTEEIAAERGISCGAIHQINRRFRFASQSQAKVELKGFMCNN